jgi:hypothetical protein
MQCHQLHSIVATHCVNMSERLRRNAPLLRALHRANPTDRKRILHKHCSADFINCVSEICKNLIKRCVPLSSHQKEQLRRRHKTIHKLTLKKVSKKQKKKIIQSGGFLGAILSTIIPVLGSLLGGLVHG